MINHQIKSKAVKFINEEIERILKELESGAVNRDQAIGSLNTVFNISSGIEDVKHMQIICRLIDYIRTTTYFFQLRKKYANHYFHQSVHSAEEKMQII